MGTRDYTHAFLIFGFSFVIYVLYFLGMLLLCFFQIN